MPIAVVLAAGLGERMRPVSRTHPKPLLPILGTSLLECNGARLRSAGVSEVLVAYSYASALFRAEAEHVSRKMGLSVQLVADERPSGPAGSMLVAARNAHLDGDDLLVISGDGLSDLELVSLLAHHRQAGAALTVAVTEVADWERFGVTSIDPSTTMVRSVEEKPTRSPNESLHTRLVSMGTYVLSSSALANMSCQPYPPDFDFCRHVIPALLSSGDRVAGYIHRGFWLDIGNPQTYLGVSLEFAESLPKNPGQLSRVGIDTAQIAILSGPNGGTQVAPCLLIGEVSLGNVKLQGPLVLHGPATIENDVVLERVVVLSGAYVAAGKTIRNAVVHP